MHNALLAASLIGILTPVPAIAGDLTADITVKNRSLWEIHHLFMSPVSSNNWGPDQLGSKTVASDGTFDLSGVACDTYDVKIVDEDGDECILNGVAICGANETWEITNESLLQCQVASPSPSTASSGDSVEWKQQLTQQTEIKSGPDYGNLASKGYSLIDVAKTGLLDKDTAETLSLTLPLGRSYILMGVCDNDCSDLDLAVVKGGVELSTDTTDDDWPMVEVTPTGSADYQLKVGMYSCSAPNCGYQITVWAK